MGGSTVSFRSIMKTRTTGTYNSNSVETVLLPKFAPVNEVGVAMRTTKKAPWHAAKARQPTTRSVTSMRHRPTLHCCHC